jgi:hypothetical protein
MAAPQKCFPGPSACRKNGSRTGEVRAAVPYATRAPAMKPHQHPAGRRSCDRTRTSPVDKTESGEEP